MFFNTTESLVFSDIFLGESEGFSAEVLQRAVGIIGIFSLGSFLGRLPKMELNSVVGPVIGNATALHMSWILPAIRNLSNITSFGLLLSPVPTFYQIWKKGSVQEFSPVPYLSALLNCMLWTLYGLPMVTPNGLLVITTNGSGSIIEVCFVLLFLVYSNGKKRLFVFLAFFMEVGLVLTTGLLVLNYVHTLDQRSTIVGFICVFVTVLMYGAPLSVMKMVIQTKSVEYMPLSVSLASLANAVCWTTYALLRYDLFIMVPHTIGAMLAIAQLILYVKISTTNRILIQNQERESSDSLYEDSLTEKLLP